MNNLFDHSKFFVALLLLCFASASWAAAPDDINANMRVWFDAYDINGNDDFSDNPGSGATITTWVDKSGNGRDVSHPTASRRPILKTLATNYGVKFSGAQRLFRAANIWVGTVDDIDIFAATSTDVRTNSWLVSSSEAGPANPTRRIGTHVPWSDSNVYWDRGSCCGSSRLNGIVPILIGTDTKYLWNFYASSNATNAPFGSNQRMYVIQNGNNALSNNNSDSYASAGSDVFGIGARPNSDSDFFNGTIGETILYQRTLNTTERNILNSYLFARWQTPGTLIDDQYAGDTVAAYYYHVGGIGRTNGSSGGIVSTGTSRGLTITRISGGNNRYLMAGLKDLIPPSGTVTTNLPATVSSRSARDWYLDRSPNNGNPQSTLTFDLTAMGITATAGDEYALLYRATTGTAFSILQLSTVVGSTVVGSTVSYNVSGPSDGFYTIGSTLTNPEFTLQKTVLVESDPINGSSLPKAIPQSEHIYTVTLSNASASGSNTPDTIVIDDAFDDNLTFFTGDLDGGGSPIDFDEGTPSCDLSFNFAGYASTTDDAAFYDATNTAVTSVTPDVDGYDANIRRIELTPQGSFAVKSGSNEPFCTFKYKVRVD